MADTAYCVKCKATVPVKNGRKGTMKNGRPILKGTCSTCGTALSKIVSVKKN